MTKNNIIVIGSCGRIGNALCARLIDEGKNVIAIDNNKEALERQNISFKNDSFTSYEADISFKESLINIFEDIEERFGEVDGAVNTSYPKNKNYGAHFFDVTRENFIENVGLHMSAYFIFMQHCASYSVDKNLRFSLVNISSIYGVIPPKFDIYKGTDMTMPVEYAAIKSGLIHLAKYTTSFTKGSKFRVNTISPGGLIDDQDKSFIAKYKEYSRSKGMLNPEDLLGAICFLLSDEAEFICGQNIIIDDGFSN